MTFSNLKNIERTDKSEASQYLNELRTIYNRISILKIDQNRAKNLLKPSSDIFRDMYYSNRNNPYICASCLIGIKKNTFILAKTEGFDSALDMALDLYQITDEVYSNLIETMENLVPRFRKYFKDSNYYKIYTYYSEEEGFSYRDAKRFIPESIGKFSKDAEAVANRAFNESWIDSDPKSSDPLCINIPCISEFRLKLRYENNTKSLLSLAHEIGHGYHGTTLFDGDILNFSYPLSIAESSALFFEEIVYESIPDALKSQELYNINLSLFTIDVYARFLFEKRVFEDMHWVHLGCNALDEYMRDAMKHAYGNIYGIDERLWLNKSHYYNLTRPYYNITYIYGLFIAKTLYALYKKEPEGFDEKYREFFSRTNTVEIVPNLKEVFGIDIEDKKYWKDFENGVIANLDKVERNNEEEEK